MNKSMTAKDQMTEFLLYTAPSGEVKVEVFLHNENLWLTQDRIAELFGVQRPAITKHLINIFADGELEEIKVSSILEHTTKHGAIEGKIDTDRQNNILFINAQDIFTPIDRTHNTWTEKQIAEIASIVRRYRDEDGYNKYEDIKGRCKVATLEEIKADWEKVV